MTGSPGILAQRGYRNGIELATIQGSTDPDDRADIRARFTAPPDKHPVRVLVATDSAGEGIDLQDYCHRLVNFDIPFNPSRLEQRIGRIDRYGQQNVPEIYQLTPAPPTTKYARDLRFLIDIVTGKIKQVAADLGSVNQVIDVDAEIQEHLTGRKGRRSAGGNGSAIIGRVLAGGQDGLDRTLTELSRTYDEQKARMHLTPANARRVVDTALTLTAQPPLNNVGDDRTDAEVFAIPALGPAWQLALRGLDTRLKPGELRHVTFDDRAAAGREDLVHIHLGHALLQRSARTLRSALFSVDSPVHRVTAVVADGLPQSCVAAVSRLVLVGRGGLRLHEEVFLTGIRIRGQAMAEEKVEAVLDKTLDAEDLMLADEAVRRALAELWNHDGSPLRTRLLTAMTRKATARQEHGHRRPLQAPRHRHRSGRADLRRLPGQPPRVTRTPGPRDSRAGRAAVPRRPAAAAPPRPGLYGRHAADASTARSSARSPPSAPATRTSSRTSPPPPSCSR